MTKVMDDIVGPPDCQEKGSWKIGDLTMQNG